MQLRKLSETANAITLGWTPVPGCDGYLFYRDGIRVSRTFDPARSSIKFSKGNSYRVEAIRFAVVEGDDYPDSTTPPPPPYKKVAPRVAYADGGSDARYCMKNPDGSLRPGVSEQRDGSGNVTGYRDEVAEYDTNGLCRGIERSGGSANDGIVSALNIDGREYCDLPMTGDPTKNTGSWIV